ncbi:hypothetical protein Tco_0003730 [Tanacetum coccineum]
MSLQEMEDLKQHYLDEMLSLSNDLQIKDYRNEKIDFCFRRECEDTIYDLKVAKLCAYPSQRFKYCCYDDDDDYDYEESTIPLNEIDSQIPPTNAIIPVLLTLEPEDSLSMVDEHLSTIPEKESDEFIKSSVENLEKSVTFSNPLFNSNDDLTSSDDESLSDEDVLEDNVKIYSNPLFEFDDEYISSNVNLLFDEVLEDIECKDCPDFEDSRTHGFVHRSLYLQSFACLYLGIRYPRS